MTNAKTDKSINHKSNVATSPSNSTGREGSSYPTRRTDVGLKPATPLEVLVSRSLDEELEWYFSYAEAALHRESVGMLPNYAVIRILATEPTDESFRIRAHELARTVRNCLSKVHGRQASVLRAVYTPRRWPSRIERAFHVLAPIAFAIDPWPPRLSAHTGLEEAVAARLSAALGDPAKVKVTKLRTQAQRLLGNAVVAYAKARALEGVALGIA
jgi:hypothetical protein